MWPVPWLYLAIHAWSACNFTRSIYLWNWPHPKAIFLKNVSIFVSSLFNIYVLIYWYIVPVLMNTSKWFNFQQGICFAENKRCISRTQIGRRSKENNRFVEKSRGKLGYNQTSGWIYFLSFVWRRMYCICDWIFSSFFHMETFNTSWIILFMKSECYSVIEWNCVNTFVLNNAIDSLDITQLWTSGTF